MNGFRVERDSLNKLEIDNLRKKVQSYNRSDLKRGRLKYYVRFEKFMEEELTLNQVGRLIQESYVRHGKMVCYLCSREVFLDYQKKNPAQVRGLQQDQFTLDRLDNKKSHRIDNVKICCLTCNILRSDQYEPEEFTWKFKLRPSSSSATSSESQNRSVNMCCT